MRVNMCSEIDCAAPITEQRERTEEQPDQASGWLEDGAEPDPEETLAQTLVEQVDETFSETGDSDFDDDEERDDLMKIDGIGPALQNRLYAFHIRTYKKLASLDDLEIERLERQLDDNEGLSVADWVRQAQELEKPL